MDSASPHRHHEPQQQSARGKEAPVDVQVSDVRSAMNSIVLTVGPGHTLREASRSMIARKVGAAVVVDPDGEGAGIVTERDLLHALADGRDPDRETVGTHLTSEIVYANPGWTLEQAAEAMLRGGFRHLVVMESGEVVGILSVRDIVRQWHTDRVSQRASAQA
jgi:CBS domain-containing protein